MIKVKNKTNHCLRATKTQRILAGYGTHISVGDAALVLDFIDKLSRLSMRFCKAKGVFRQDY